LEFRWFLVLGSWSIDQTTVRFSAALDGERLGPESMRQAIDESQIVAIALIENRLRTFNPARASEGIELIREGLKCTVTNARIIDQSATAVLVGDFFNASDEFMIRRISMELNTDRGPMVCAAIVFVRPRSSERFSVLVGSGPHRLYGLKVTSLIGVPAN
jgi:hypothetical protein